MQCWQQRRQQYAIAGQAHHRGKLTGMPYIGNQIGIKSGFATRQTDFMNAYSDMYKCS